MGSQGLSIGAIPLQSTFLTFPVIGLFKKWINHPHTHAKKFKAFVLADVLWLLYYKNS